MSIAFWCWAQGSASSCRFSSPIIQSAVKPGGLVDVRRHPLLFVLAGLQLIWGLAGLLRTTMFLVASTGLGITWNYTVWSWIFIGMAVLTGLTGLAGLGRVAPARYAGIFLASVLMFANFLTPRCRSGR